MMVMTYEQAAKIRRALKPAQTPHERRIYAHCARNGISVHRQGRAIRFHGMGIDLLAAGFAFIQISDLEPHHAAA
jgi:hypothetical protein